MSDLTIRVARPETDAPRCHEIYAPYVRDTAITFEYKPPTLAEFTARMEHTLERYPYLVAERPGADGQPHIVGYVYASPFKARPAYDWAVETSIYVDAGARGRRVGSLLHEGLERTCRIMGIRNLEACIAWPDEGGSVGFHTRMGYRMVGQFDRCGCKFGRWYHMAWMEKVIAPHVPDPAPFRPFPALAGAELAALLRP